MRYLPSKTAILIYAIGYLAMAALTAKDLYPLWREYIQHNIATEIELINGNESRTAPSLVLCVPYDNSISMAIDGIKPYNPNSTCFGCLPDLNYSNVPSWATSFLQNITQSAADIKDVIRARLREELFLDKIDDRNVINDISQRQYLAAAWEFFACLTQADAIFPTVPPSNCTPFRSGELPEKWRIETIFDRFLDVVASHIACYESPARQACSTSVSKSEIKKMLDESKRFALGTDSMCFRLPQTIDGFSLLYSGSLTIGQGPGGQGSGGQGPGGQGPGGQGPGGQGPGGQGPGGQGPGGQGPGGSVLKRSYRIFEGTGESFLNLVAKSSPPMGQYSKLYHSPPPISDSPSVEVVDIQYRTTMRISENRPSEPCFQDQDLFSCVLRCKLNKTLSTCKCVPFTYQKVVPAEYQFLPYCIPDDDIFHKNCTRILSDMVDKCKEDCGTNPCQNTFYDWRVTSSVGPYNARGAGLTVTVTPILSPFPQLRVVYKNSVESFIANVGGVAGLYLGIDGVGLCAIVLFFIDRIRDYIGKGQNQPSSKIGQTNHTTRGLSDQLSGLQQDIAHLRNLVSAVETKVEARQVSQNEQIEQLINVVDAIANKMMKNGTTSRWGQKF